MNKEHSPAQKEKGTFSTIFSGKKKAPGTALLKIKFEMQSKMKE